MNQLIDTLDLYFGKKAPQMPAGIKEFIVKVSPWLSVVGVILTVPAVLAILGLGAYFSSFARYGMVGYGYSGFGIWSVFTIIMTVLYIMAIPGLFKRSPSGWNFMFYAALVGGLQNLISFNLVGLVVGLLIGFYILFQLKPYYFGGATTSPFSGN